MIRMPDVAIIQDALPFRGGAERVIEAVLEIAPTAPVYTAVYCKEHFADSILRSHTVHTSFIDRLPGARANHYRYAPLFPWAMERFDLRAHEVALSFSYAFAHGILPEPDQLHLCYMYTPLRYAWRSAALHDTFTRSKAVLVSAWMHYVRLWDLAAAARVDHFIAISQWVAACIRRAYRRSAEVIYPPVDVDDFRWDQSREDHYIAVGRLVRHKRVSLIVDAFSRLGYPIYIVGDGPEHDHLAERAAANVRLLGRQSRSKVAELLSRARGFIHAAEEDFGITMVEAQAAGCPVIAYGKGASRETVVDGKTGLFFPEQSVESLMTAVRAFEESNVRLDPGELRRNAERFRKERFQRELATAVEREWSTFKRKPVP